jgi:hypothetical protein
MTRPNYIVLVAVAAACGYVAMVTSAQTRAGLTAKLTANAPIYLKAEVSEVPLRVVAAGTILKVLDQQGDWVQVEFEDPQWGRRVGWVERSLVEFSTRGLQPTGRTEARPAPAAAPSRPTPPSPPAEAFPQYETALGWSFVNAGTGVNSTLGFDTSLVGNLTPWYGAVLDASVNRFVEQVPGFGEMDVATYAVLAGPRFALRQSGLVVPAARSIRCRARKLASGVTTQRSRA